MPSTSSSGCSLVARACVGQDNGDNSENLEIVFFQVPEDYRASMDPEARGFSRQ